MTQLDHKKASELIAKLYGVGAGITKTVMIETVEVKTGFMQGCCGNPLPSGQCCGNAIPEPYQYQEQVLQPSLEDVFIIQDSGTMAELAWENRISPIFYPREVHIVLHDGTCVHEYYADHTSIAEATRVAIAKALIKLKGKDI